MRLAALAGDKGRRLVGLEHPRLQLLVQIEIFDPRRPALGERALHAGADREFHARGLRDRRCASASDGSRRRFARPAPAAGRDAARPIDEPRAEGVAEPAAQADEIIAVLVRGERVAGESGARGRHEETRRRASHPEIIQIGLDAINDIALPPIIADLRAEARAGAIPARRGEVRRRRRRSRRAGRRSARESRRRRSRRYAFPPMRKRAAAPSRPRAER